MPSIRILPYALADGAWNMAADEVMLELAIAGAACVRVYAWDPPTLSLGYFQHHEERLLDPRLAMLPWVRRATGGGAILHDHDLTYAIALPRILLKGQSPAAWHCHIHRILTNLLRGKGIPAVMAEGQRAPPEQLQYLCFAVPQPDDVVLAGAKIIGGAQRLRSGALLQHGSIQLPGAREMRDHFPSAIAAALGLDAFFEPWVPAEIERIRELADSRYRQDHWNRKR
jgi:lipoate-protein ligase A